MSASESRQSKPPIEPLDRSKDLLPFQRAHQLKQCSLYWIPVRCFPVPQQQREWLLLFLNRFSEVTIKRGLRTEQFLQVKTIEGSLSKVFQKTSQDFVPMMGLSIEPGGKMPAIPTEQDLEPIIKGRKKFSFKEAIGDYAFWFADKAATQQRELFLGYGGFSMLCLKPDPNTKPPVLPFSKAHRQHPIFQAVDVDRTFATMCSLSDAFLKKSKELFGGALKDDPQLDGLVFILPLLETRHFFSRSSEEIDSWFQLFDMYINESVADIGLLIASKPNIDEELIRIVAEMTEQGLVYPK